MKMQRVTRLKDFPNADRAVVLAIGAFDGLHLGHQAVIRDARALADRGGASLAVLRFFPHPTRLLRPEVSPELLCTEEQIEAGLDDLEVDVHLRLPFTIDLANLDAEAFLHQLSTSLPALQGIVVGPNWRFGREGRGDIRMLQEHAGEYGFEVWITDSRRDGDAMISATRIRAAVQEGELADARAMLGRPHRLSGIVQEGKQLGRQLGFRTANFIPEQECLPPGGVYATHVHVNGTRYEGAGYLRQISEQDAPFTLAEVHLLDTELDLYGKRIEVDLLDWIRPAEPIPDFDALRDQIERDVATIRERLDGDQQE